MRKVVALIAISLLANCTERPLVTARDMPPPPLPGGAAPAATAMPVVPPGYAVQPLAAAVQDPRALLFDSAGALVVVEGAPARLSRVESDGRVIPLAQGGGNGPWTGAALSGGRLFVAEAGGPLGGRVLEVRPDGTTAPLPVKLPGGNLVGPLAAGPDGWLYVGIASAAATGQVADIPCQDRRIGGRKVSGRVPCTGSVLRVRPDGAMVEMHSWGWRAPTALGFAADGRLLVADGDAAGGQLHQALAGLWYGEPDSQLASADPSVAGPNPPPAPLARVDAPAAALAATDRATFGGPDEVFLALPDRVAFTSLSGGTAVPFAVNLGQPRALAFAPDGSALWVADAAGGTLWRIAPEAAALPRPAPSATSVPKAWRAPLWKVGCASWPRSRC